MASSSPEIIIGQVAAATSSIRVGSAATLMSHYSPLKVAEVFGTLASYFPDRIDLGLGRAPGSNRLVAQVLNPTVQQESDYPQKVQQLLALLHGEGLSASDGRMSIQAIPGNGTEVPIWLHGSGTYSAQLAGILGLPFSFAGHFAPAGMEKALDIYRENFQPSQFLDKPYSLVAISAVAADSEYEARRLATTIYMKYLMVDAGDPGPMQHPVDPDKLWDSYSASQRASAEQQLERMIVGDRDSVYNGITSLVERSGADEILLQAELFDHDARIRSYEIIAEAMGLMRLDNMR